MVLCVCSNLDQKTVYALGNQRTNGANVTSAILTLPLKLLSSVPILAEFFPRKRLRPPMYIMRNLADFEVDTTFPPYAARSDKEAPIVTIELNVTADTPQCATQNLTKDWGLEEAVDVLAGISMAYSKNTRIFRPSICVLSESILRWQARGAISGLKR